MTWRAARRLLIAATAASIALAAPVPAAAGTARLRVQTQNLYVGADLDPAFRASTPDGYYAAVNEIWRHVRATDFGARATRVADEIAHENPDLVALQEVAEWSAADITGTIPSYDFLQKVLAALGDRGLSYVVAAVSDNATIGPVVLPSPWRPRFELTFHDRDAILVRNRPGLTFANPMHGNYIAAHGVGTALGPVTLTRAWAAIDGMVEGQPFRFVNTHLESEAASDVQLAQAKELLGGPVDAPGPIIAAGDFSSAADGANSPTYGVLTQAFTDAWSRDHAGAPGYTCCHDADLLGNHALDERIDLVLYRGGPSGTRARNVELIGDRRNDRTADGMWPSDHAGVVATISFG